MLDLYLYLHICICIFMCLYLFLPTSPPWLPCQMLDMCLFVDLFDCAHEFSFKSLEIRICCEINADALKSLPDRPVFEGKNLH